MAEDAKRLPVRSPVKVLHLFVSLPVGGAENLLLSILQRLDNRRFDSMVCCIGKRGAIGERIAAAGIPLVELGLLERGGHDRRVTAALVQLIRRENIQLVHSHLYHANLYGRLAAKQAGVACIASVHNTYTRPKPHRRLINWWLGRRTAAIIVGSEEIRRDVVRYDWIPSEKVRVIHNAVDLTRSESNLTRSEARQRLGLADGDFVLGTVGRLEQQKGHRFLLYALAAIQPRHPNTRLLLVGDGREKEALTALAHELGMDRAVRFLGTRNDLGDLFRAMDVFVMPSLWEGLSLAMLSAMAAELPVVATNVGGVAQALDGGNCGTMVAPGDSAALTEAILRCLNDPASCQAAATRGARRVRDCYGDQAMVASLQTVYDTALACPAPE